MIKVFVYYIAKQTQDISEAICQEFALLCGGFGVQLEFINAFCKTIKEGQKVNAKLAQASYSQVFLKSFKNHQYRIALTPQGKVVDSYGFAELLQNKTEIVFFIGGAYGLEESFLRQCHQCVSLSNLTLSHKVAKIVLSEQIYRGFGLLNHHPYHK